MTNVLVFFYQMTFVTESLNPRLYFIAGSNFVILISFKDSVNLFLFPFIGFNRLGVVGAVLQTDLKVINQLILFLKNVFNKDVLSAFLPCKHLRPTLAETRLLSSNYY